MKKIKTMSTLNRREFIIQTAMAAPVFGLTFSNLPTMEKKIEPIFKISLAEWSLNRLLFGGKLDHLDFPLVARQHGINAVEYVNQFFMDKAEDQTYLREMKDRADGEGVRSVLIMCDREGRLGDPDEARRLEAVDNHKKWVEAAKYLGCHSIRVNGYSEGSSEEQMKLVADGLRRLCEISDPYGLNVIIENHGGFSSNGKWLTGVMEMADHPRAGTLPDFGNFRISGRGEEVESYDSYRGVKELMPYARGVSVKTTVWDDEGNSSELDYERMMRIVLDAGYRGYCGIEHGPEGKEWEGIMEVKKHLEETRDALKGEYAR
jgi:sugar phosphate isomerase/epimerase